MNMENMEMSEREELSDGDLDGVNGGFSFHEIKQALVDAINSVTGRTF